jgi:2-polyprenyl-3-methyl-5-hydroxy-6-metoxy-1,4-benzoquinol methylase
MTLRVDPERFEIEALETLTDWRGKRVLEIGCGEGRLTQRLARLGADIDAIDPDAKLVAKARKNLPKRFASRARFRTGKAEKLGHRDGWFDAVVFAWAL